MSEGALGHKEKRIGGREQTSGRASTTEDQKASLRRHKVEKKKGWKVVDRPRKSQISIKKNEGKEGGSGQTSIHLDLRHGEKMNDMATKTTKSFSTDPGKQSSARGRGRGSTRNCLWSKKRKRTSGQSKKSESSARGSTSKEDVTHWETFITCKGNHVRGKKVTPAAK